MRFLLLLFCFFWLLPQAAFAQITVSGRVVDAESGAGLPGVTVLQIGTNNGASTDNEGNFAFSIPSSLDSISLAISSIGYISQRQRIAVHNAVLIKMAVNQIKCYAEPRAEFYLTSGLRYAPYGASLKLNGDYFLRIPLAATLGYQTNFSRNYAFTGKLEVSAAWLHRIVSSQAFAYEQFQALPANARFTSYRTSIRFSNLYKVTLLRQFNFLLGGGYARYQTLAVPEGSTVAGFGYSVGIGKDYFAKPVGLSGELQATHWSGFWQYQARLAH